MIGQFRARQVAKNSMLTIQQTQDAMNGAVSIPIAASLDVVERNGVLFIDGSGACARSLKWNEDNPQR